MEGELRFRLLGPVEATRNGETVALGGRRQRALLALLLLESGRPVAIDRLAEELWQGRPPVGAATTLRSYVSRLRAALDGQARVVAGPAGYALEVSPDTIDAHRFERLTKEGEDALARRRARRARELLCEALELWRGRPFADLADDGALQVEAERLEDLRLLALEGRIQADLELGGGADLVDELEALVSAHSFRERLWYQLMLALYRAGRQADALAAYRRARELLDRELGLEPSVELRSLEHAILRHELPVVAAPEQRHNLPAPVTSFVGRERELGQVERLLADMRMVTLTGVGGVGKTRLALEAAARAAPDFPDGVCFVDFAALADPAFVGQRVTAALDVSARAEASIDHDLPSRLREADLLLVLDNCEHLRDACAELARNLLEACPLLRVLATSREVLGVSGEVDLPVPPLTLPGAGADEAELRSSEAVRLFVERARASRANLPPTASLFETAARICQDLDGLPLAIELAAARAKALSLDEIATRLADRFRFLVSWRRLTASRHRTLREAMDWSYELLSMEERKLLAHLSVFAGGFTLTAASGLCVDGDDERALELIARLVDASLVVAEDRNGEMRYRFLETVRQYAAECLAEAGDAEPARERHADWFLLLAEEAEPKLTGGEQTRWLRVLDAERENLLAALNYLATSDVDRRLRLAIALSRFWYVRGYLAEGRQQLREAVAAAETAPPALRRRALTAAASLALLQGDHADAIACAEQALLVARASGDSRYVANALSNLGAIALAAGDHARAAGLLEEAVTLARAVGDDRIAALAINNLGDLALTVGDYARAEPCFQESLELLQSRGDTANIARSLFNLGAVALKLGRLGDAEARLRESVGFADQAGDKEDLAWCLEGFAALAAAEGRGDDAARLLGAAGALLEAMGAEFKPFERQLHDETRATALGLLGDAATTTAEREGATMGVADAIASALAERSRA